jgi:transposase-like protein
MPAPHPKEFRDDVVAVTRRGEAPISQVAKDFGISESCLRNWLRAADTTDGGRRGARMAVARRGDPDAVAGCVA